jgi:hypothetical protein
MAQIKRGYCKHCGSMRKVEKSGVNHTFHGFLTLLTCGGWIPIYIICSIANPTKWRCWDCGSSEITNIR